MQITPAVYDRLDDGTKYGGQKPRMCGFAVRRQGLGTADFIRLLGNGGCRAKGYDMLRPTVVSTVAIWARSLVLAVRGYLLFTILCACFITGLYYWLLLIASNDAWGQISLTGAAVVTGSAVARHVYVRNRSHLPSDKSRVTAIQAGILCGWKLWPPFFCLRRI